MKNIFLIFVLMLMVFSVSAKEGEKDSKTKNTAKYDLVYVAGQVTDSNTGETLVGVEVQLEETGQKTYTDFDGNFTFENVITGEYNILVNYISYEKTRVEKQKVKFDTDLIKVKMEPVKL